MTRPRTRSLAGLLLGAFFVAMGLGACTAARQAVIGQGVAQIRQAKDTEAAPLKASVCAMSIGAYHRVNSDSERRALDVLCGGEWERPVSVDNLRSLRELGELLGGS